MPRPSMLGNRIIDCLARGLTYKETAAELGTSPAVVNVTLYRIRQTHPKLASRLGAVRHAVRDHERQQAIRLDEWIKANGGTLSEDALAAIRSILADQVADILK